ncbi:MAG: DUF3857 domain-containing protein [Kofleriaceae bacterium]|nr:DUF3857 domain-containing protein [Kofleriaceae bacterium]
MKVVVLLVAVLPSVAAADPVLDKPAFTATPAELIAAAKAAPHGTKGGDVVNLREEHDMSYDDQGRLTMRERYVFQVLTQDGANGWDHISSTWLPAFQDRPVFRARVIDTQGRVTDLDPKQLVESPAVEDGAADDRKRLSGKLPGLRVGSIVEEEVVIVDRVAMYGASHGIGTGIGDTSAFTASSRVTFSAPAKTKLHVLAAALPGGVKPKVATANGRQTWTYTFGPLEMREDDIESYMPGDVRLSHVEASVAQSWNAIARAMRAVVDKQIAAGPISLPADLPTTQTLDTARAIVAWAHRQVRSTWTDFNDTSMVPATPADTLKRGTGDAKNKATLIVAALRQAKIRAELAVINYGPGLDAEADVPALTGFDHVLVRARIGSADVWIDPAQDLLQVGRLPDYAQGRRALVFADDAKALVTTPASLSTDNVIREVRTFELPEAHYGKVTEVSTEGGVFESSQRDWIRNSSGDEVKKSLTTYVTSTFSSAKMDKYTTTGVEDLDKPFEMTIVASDTQRAQALRRELVVYLFPSDTFDRIPEVLKNTKASTTKRKNDLQVPRPHVHEIENRIVIPVGFTLPTPAPESTKALGTMKLVTTQRLDGRTFIVTFRLDTGKSRLTPTEVRDIQDAIRAAWDQPAMKITIDHSAFALLKAGKVKDAIAEAQKLIQLHPKEALHHDQLALIYLDAGAGEAARREARKAVELEPKNADPYSLLGWILSHDTYGRRFGFDHDRAAARSALETAVKLSPTHHGARIDLATLLEHNAAGRRFEVGSDLRAAAEAWKGAYGVDGDADTGNSRMRALLWGGDFVTAEKWGRTLPAGDIRNMLLVAAIAAGPGGPTAAIREASALTTSGSRTQVLDGAAGILMLIRQYDAFRALKTEAGTLSGPQATTLRNLARVDRTAKTPSVDDMLAELIQAAVDPSHPKLPFADKQTETEMTAANTKALVGMAHQELMTAGVIGDILRSSGVTKVEGDAKAWRLELAVPGMRGAIYLIGDRASPTVIGSNDAPQGVGRHVLRLLAKKDEATAMRLLDWLADDVASLNTMTSRSIQAVWGDNLPRTKQAQELAAAIAANRTEAARVLPILVRCGATTSEGQLACDSDLAYLYYDAKRWTDLENHTRAWATRAQKYAGPTAYRAQALAQLGRFDEATKVIEEGLAADPDNLWLVMTAVEVSSAQGKVADAVKRVDALAKNSKTSKFVMNELAWLELVEGSDIAAALDDARQAVTFDPKNRNTLHTLASILAERGEVLEALKTDWESMAVAGVREPGGEDYYVHGRILEQIGLSADAIASYRKVKKPTTLTPGSYVLANRRLNALGAAPRK